jgi:hypothetical protein
MGLSRIAIKHTKLIILLFVNVYGHAAQVECMLIRDRSVNVKF